MQLLLTLTACVAIGLGTLLLVNNRPLTAGVAYSLALLCAVLFPIIRTTANLKCWAKRILSLVFTLILLETIDATSSQVAWCWLMLIPTLSYLLLGRTCGLQFTLFFLSIGLTLFAWQARSFENMNAAYVANIALCTLTVWGIIHIYEFKRQKMKEQLQELAAKDPLTGLLNRLHLTKVVDQLQDKGAPESSFSLLLLDLDHFKAINDQFGHMNGDQVLVHVASVIRRSIRHSDWAFRVGGEEFCLILPATSRSGAVKVAESLRGCLQRSPCITREHTIPVTLSIGIAHWPLDGSYLQALYHNADQRLYQAKATGRNCVVAGPSALTATAA
ncbi:GGDEF domain-containing protein [Ferrimonas pelagia]|uniref:diguanylate cyclase n=2 Tax=Ferrimonas pelagia TaxID=1177826 RepID=A0ABP9EPC6_9GAMM